MLSAELQLGLYWLQQIHEHSSFSQHLGELGMADPARSWAKEEMPQELSGRRVEILECTLRDGNYAVDFKFTENDTAVLAGVLGRLGFRWIEVGHGLGLGAAKAGKGTMPSSDERLIEAAKRSAPNALI